MWYARKTKTKLCAALFAATLPAVPWRAGAQNVPLVVQSAPRSLKSIANALQAAPGAPRITASQLGTTIERVTVETYGVPADVVRRYLTLQKGSFLEQGALDRDYANLVNLGRLRARAIVAQGSTAHSVTLTWIVVAPWLRPVVHPLDTGQPLSPIPGLGFAAMSAPIDARGTQFAAYGLSNGLANLGSLLITAPVAIDPVAGRQADFIADVFGGRGVYRASEPAAINVYSWTAGEALHYLVRQTNGTQFEFALRQLHSTDAQPSGIVAPSLYSTYKAPALNTLLEAGLLHVCTGAPTQLYPPYCESQYRLEVIDAIGGFGATNEYQVYVAGITRYISVGASTLALYLGAARTGGVLSDSFLVCASGRAYPKAFCGTDAQSATAEYRIGDALPTKLKVVLFTETAASRVREGSQPWALATYQWHAGSGIGLVYGGIVRLDLAYGSQGARLWFALKGASF